MLSYASNLFLSQGQNKRLGLKPLRLALAGCLCIVLITLAVYGGRELLLPQLKRKARS